MIALSLGIYWQVIWSIVMLVLFTYGHTKERSGSRRQTCVPSHLHHRKIYMGFTTPYPCGEQQMYHTTSWAYAKRTGVWRENSPSF